MPAAFLTGRTPTLPRPNLLILLTDQQRRDSLGCTGHPCARTPHLDALARGGIRFDRHYVANPICMPNRLSILTGRHPRNHGLWTNGIHLDPLPQTLPGHLHAAGWHTASFGKIHLTPTGGVGFEAHRSWHGLTDDQVAERHGPYAGFEQVELTLGHNCAPLAHYGRWFRALGGTTEMLTTDETGSRRLPPALHPSSFVAARAAAFIERERDPGRPFCCVASFPDPHHPFDAPRACYDAVDPQRLPSPIGGPADLATRPEHFRTHFSGGWLRQGSQAPRHPDGIDAETCQRWRRHTTAMVELIDAGVGTILAALDRSGQRDQTLLLFLSDHGELLGDHGLWLKGPFLYEGLINTPLLVSGPGLPRGVSSRALVSDVDLAPTLCSLLAVDPLPWCDGHDLSACWRGDRDGRDHCLIEYRNGYGANDRAMAALVTAGEKYIRYQDGEEEFTDLRADPEERVNRRDDPRLPALRERLLDVLLGTGARGPAQVSHA